MKILVTNDDGIQSEGLWALVRELKAVAEVTVVAPEREQSAIGTAVSLFQVLKVRQIASLVPGVTTYAVEGTPGDCVILALGRLIDDDIDLVISGINLGPNVGDDVLISGTVAGALQGYLHGCHALAVSQQARDGGYLDGGAWLATRLVQWLDSCAMSDTVFINANLPARPLGEVGGVQITRLASDTHIDMAEASSEGGHGYYRLVRQRRDNHAAPQTDVWALERGFISLTPLHTELFRRSSPVIPEALASTLLREIKGGGETC